MQSVATEDREGTWLDLLRRVTEVCPGCAADGNLDEGFAGEGDIDMVAPTDSWPALEHEFREWSSRRELGPVIVCRHRPGVVILLALGNRHTTFYEMEARGLRYFRGTLLYRAEDLVPMMEMDPRGFRKLRRGAGAMIRLLPSGTRWDGRLKWKGPRINRVAQWLREDRQGVVESSKLYGAARGAALSAAESVMAGGWDRKAMLTVGGWGLAKSFARPDVLVKRSISRISGEKECLVLTTLKANSRKVPDDADRWLDAVRESHEVYE